MNPELKENVVNLAKKIYDKTKELAKILNEFYK